LNEELEGEILYPIVHIKEEDIEVAITHSDKSQTETYFSFVNGQNTTQGGTHLNAFREAYVKTIREFFNKILKRQMLESLLSLLFPSM
jgi:topoisomerase-4 subunit B